MCEACYYPKPPSFDWAYLVAIVLLFIAFWVLTPAA